LLQIIVDGVTDGWHKSYFKPVSMKRTLAVIFRLKHRPVEWINYIFFLIIWNGKYVTLAAKVMTMQLTCR